MGVHYCTLKSRYSLGQFVSRALTDPTINSIVICRSLAWFPRTNYKGIRQDILITTSENSENLVPLAAHYLPDASIWYLKFLIPSINILPLGMDWLWMQKNPKLHRQALYSKNRIRTRHREHPVIASEWASMKPYCDWTCTRRGALGLRLVKIFSNTWRPWHTDIGTDLSDTCVPFSHLSVT